MKASEIQKGDVLVDPSNGRLVYTVEDVKVGSVVVTASVRYRDGGTSSREWYPDTDVPLTWEE